MDYNSLEKILNINKQKKIKILKYYDTINESNYIIYVYIKKDKYILHEEECVEYVINRSSRTKKFSSFKELKISLQIIFKIINSQNYRYKIYYKTNDKFI